MTYEEKGTWAYLVASVGVWVGYVVVLWQRADGGSLADVAYVGPLLWAVGASILANTVGRVLFEVVRPSESHQADVRDREVARFGDHVGGIVLSVLVAGVLVLALVEAAHFWIANAIYAAFVIQVVVASVLKVVAYRRGL
ncbi:hypothetical protein [Georgenia wangjunii]|uniref:hypothetical protein n=1 Tax=Georgenia wangjunii TaxID=3117730 RepID=UPI002F26B36C